MAVIATLTATGVIRLLPDFEARESVSMDETGRSGTLTITNAGWSQATNAVIAIKKNGNMTLTNPSCPEGTFVESSGPNVSFLRFERVSSQIRCEIDFAATNNFTRIDRITISSDGTSGWDLYPDPRPESEDNIQYLRNSIINVTQILYILYGVIAAFFAAYAIPLIFAIYNAKIIKRQVDLELEKREQEIISELVKLTQIATTNHDEKSNNKSDSVVKIGYNRQQLSRLIDEKHAELAEIRGEQMLHYLTYKPAKQFFRQWFLLQQRVSSIELAASSSMDSSVSADTLASLLLANRLTKRQMVIYCSLKAFHSGLLRGIVYENRIMTDLKEAELPTFGLWFTKVRLRLFASRNVRIMKQNTYVASLLTAHLRRLIEREYA